MKKNIYSKEKTVNPLKLSLKMKLTILLIVVSFFKIEANTYSQNANVSLNMKDVSVERVLHEIESLSDFKFMLMRENVDLDRRISINVNKKRIDEVLGNIFFNEDVDFKVLNKQIILKKKEKMLVSQEDIKVNNLILQQLIKGKVTDNNGEALPGVSILIKNTQKGIQTDLDGNYTITASANNVLIFSYLGFKTQEILVGSNVVINVSMQQDGQNLEEVLVVGYGKLAKKRVTGSISSISSKQIEEIPVVSIENAIVGQVAGVQVQETSGEPGASPTIRIRGTGSISAGNDPLYVVDGIPISKGSASLQSQGEIVGRLGNFAQPSSNPLATINPNDIASIEILKDASAAAIYGSRAGNGVILITTKKGSNTDEGVFSFNSFFGLQSVANRVDLMNSEELIAYTRDARNNNYISSVAGASISDPIGPGQRGNTNYEMPESFLNWDGTDTDWQKLIFKTAPMKSYNLSYASPLKNNTSFYVSGGYFNQEGVVNKTEYERFTLLGNLSSQLTDKLSLDLRLAPSLTYNQKKPVNAPYFATPPGIVYSALVHSPTVRPYNTDGSINQTNNQSHLGGGTTTASNPLAIIAGIDDQLFQFQNQASLGLSYEIVPKLIFKTFGGSYLNVYNRDYYQANSLLFREAIKGVSNAQSSSSTQFNYLWENTLNWEKESGSHYFNGIGGYSIQRDKINITQVQANKFPDDLVQTISGGQVFAGTSIEEEWSLVSGFLRMNYSFKDKYLFTGTMRSDRSSRFGNDNKTGYFPSFSLGWRVNEESFMRSAKAISELKLRISWGQTGNFEIPNYGSIGLLNPFNYNFNGTQVNGLIQSTISNPDLTWEKSAQTNIGIELGMFENRLFLLADYYKSITSDLLLNVSVSSVSGFNTTLQNLGEVENKGIELALKSRNLVGDFTWETELNLSSNKNKVLSLNAGNEPIYSAGGAGVRHVTRVGDAIGSYYGYVVDGIYKNAQDILNSPFDTQAPKPAPGDLKFKDVNGDGKITPDDRTVTGSYFPDFTWGITNRFTYKNIDMSILIQGVQGNEILNLTSRHLNNGEANFNSYSIQNERWISEQQPGNGKVPRADRESGLHGNNGRPSSYQVEDGSFVRLRNISLGYTLPSKILFGGAIDKLRVYVTGNNLFTQTDYLGYNPEVSNISSGLTPGEDYGAYPLNKTIVFGINLNF
jgi:TonB-linked SusC/RagA family outer membrane protein